MIEREHPELSADRPQTKDKKQYHTHTGAGDLSALCLIVGAPGRADLIARNYLTDAIRFANEYRGLVSYTGYYKGTRVSATTSGMGGASMGIILPEAVRSGARIFIRVGSCGSLIRESRVGDVIVPTAAIRYDGATDDWAPKEYPAVADWRVVAALHKAASSITRERFHLGIECTTSDFHTGQARPNMFGEVPERMAVRHEEVVRLGAACYAMEAATLFVWCATEGGGLPAGAINAVFGNRHTNEFGTAGEDLAISVALEALLLLAADPGMAGYISGRVPKYSADV